MTLWPCGANYMVPLPARVLTVMDILTFPFQLLIGRIPTILKTPLLTSLWSDKYKQTYDDSLHKYNKNDFIVGCQIETNLW